LPSALIKSWDEVLAEEVSAHPHARSATLLLYDLNALLIDEKDPGRLREFFSSSGLAEARADQRAAAKELPEQHAALQADFPAGSAGKYTREQADEFAWMQALHWLAPRHRAFLEQFRADVGQFNARVFKSVRLYSFVVYYKYYLGSREPRRASDFGDLAHLYAIAYCKAAIMEKDLANTLAQIKRHDAVLQGTDIYDVGVVSKWASAG
jgi:hypothetical protein